MDMLNLTDPKFSNAFVVNNIPLPEDKEHTIQEEDGHLVQAILPEETKPIDATSPKDFHIRYVPPHGFQTIVMPPLAPQQYAPSAPVLAITYEKNLQDTLKERWTALSDTYNAWSVYPEIWSDRLYEYIRTLLSEKNYLTVSKPGETVSKTKPGVVMGFAQHPHLHFVAIASKTAVTLYSVPEIQGTAKLLWNERVDNINCVSFRPNAGISVAAGYREGIVIFKIKSVPQRKEYSTGRYHEASDTYVNFLKDSSLGAVHSLSWDSTGEYLVAGSETTGKVGVWKLTGKQFSLLSHTGPVELVSWCPFSDVIFTSHAGGILNFWDNTKKQEYTKMICQAAAFSPDGKFLAVATSHIYIFSVNAVKGKPEIVNCVFVEPNANIATFNDGSRAELQEIESLAWSPDGERLAVSFSAVPMISLYKVTQLNQSFSMVPVGYVKSTAGEEELAPHVHSIAFLPNFDKGSILCICYSTATVTFTPLFYQPTTTPNTLPAIPVNSRPTVLAQPSDQTPKPTTPSPAPSPINGPILSPIVSPGYKVLYNEHRRHLLDNTKSPAFNLGY